jgi:hypothetical protein
MKLLLKGQAPAWSLLLSPFAYLWIKHPFKTRIDWWWPLVLTAMTMTLLWLLPVTPRILGEAGFLKGIRDLIALFAAFFVVALAAVSTFARRSLDQLMEGTPPTLNGRDLTRREFVCYLFGYLAALSFVLFLACIAAEIVAPSFRFLFTPNILWWIRALSGTAFAFGFWNMVTTTFLGIWFLIERIHIGGPEKDDEEQMSPSPQDRPQSMGRRAA